MAEGGAEARKRFLWGLGGVSFPKTKTEQVAANIAMTKVGTAALDPDERESHAVKREILDELRKGNSKPLYEARSKGEITLAQETQLRERARRTPLQDTVHGFSYSEAMKVYDAAKADNDKKAMEELQPVLRKKRMNMLLHRRLPEVERVEAAQ